MNRFFSMIRFFLMAMTFASLHCSIDNLSGGGTIETTNGRVTGKVEYPNGNPSPGAQVKLIPSLYDPIKDTLTIPLDTTDDSGNYAFTEVSYGTYTIQSVQCNERTRGNFFGIIVEQDTVPASPITLQKPGTVKVTLSNSPDPINGYVYIPGTEIVALVNGSAEFVVLDSVPAGILPSINYAITSGAGSQAIRYDVRVDPGDSAAITNPQWQYARALCLNTTASGAGVTGNVYNFPVLVRLTMNNFNFAQAKADGGDLRFTKQDNTPLPYEIERWDSDSKQAEIWVKVDTVFGNNSAQFITMYWGASTMGSTGSPQVSATSQSNGAAVFDTANGFRGAWHLGESAGTIFDATVNNYSGRRNGNVARTSGIIGYGQIFDGTGDYIDMGNVLNPNAASFTVSAWIKRADTALQTIQTVIGKSAGGDPSAAYGWNVGTDLLNRAHCFIASGGPNWGDAGSFQMFSDSAITQITAWHHITAVFDKSGTGNCKVYLDGADVTLAANTSVIGSLANAANLRIGAEADGEYPWKGSLDEAVVSYTIRSPDWIKQCYMNQRSDDKLVVFK